MAWRRDRGVPRSRSCCALGSRSQPAPGHLVEVRKAIRASDVVVQARAGRSCRRGTARVSRMAEAMRTVAGSRFRPAVPPLRDRR